MDVGLVLSAAQTLFAALHCSELNEMCSIFGYKSQLDDLQRTVFTVRAVLRDAETREQLSYEAQLWIQELKDAVYDADDLLDEFVTLTEQKQLMEGGKASRKVRLFFTRFNPLGVAYKMSQGVKKIRKKLDAIASNHSQFGFRFDSKPIRRRREETCSYVSEGILLDSNVQGDVSFLSIVGIGGLGKTALAQLVYNDPRVASAFPLRLWTCISDHDQEQLDVDGILRNILASATGERHEGCSKQLLQSQLREKLACSKYLLVLDDVWTEKRNHWIKLVEFLSGGQRGSWVVVTTRSQETARIVGGGPMYDLQGLLEEDSWRLFEKVAFGLEEPSPHDDLVKIGREIVEGCAGVPLALRVVGSLLCGQNKSKWLYVQEMGLANIRESQDDIMPILKLSYQNLDSPLKSCFSYCALFPKDFKIQKEMLINLWMAQGYIVPLDELQSMENAAEEYFSILLHRCFFQDVCKDEFDEIISCKIHDLMHDLAQKVAGKEICISDSITDNMNENVRHLALMRTGSTEYSFTKTHIRTFLQKVVTSDLEEAMAAVMNQQFDLEALLTNFKRLRVLDLCRLQIESLPSTLGELLHLRYLDLSCNSDLEALPKSITKLHNLETLNISGCDNLKELPRDISKLVKLRVLDIRRCSSLTCMPCGLGKLTDLHTLPEFELGEGSASWKQWFDHLEDLKALKKLKGSLCVNILFPKCANAMVDVRREGGYLKNKEHLNHISFNLSLKEVDDRAIDDEEALMEELQPHHNLKWLELSGYRGVRMPSWAMYLPNLVRMELRLCMELQHLAGLGNLQHLKYLKLLNLPKLEYIFEDNSASSGSSKTANLMPAGLTSAEVSSFLPSLVQLELIYLQKLKGWGRSDSGNLDNHRLTAGSSRINIAQLQLLCLSQLKSLEINECPELTVFPLCPRVERLSLRKFNERLQLIRTRRMDKLQDEGGEAMSSAIPILTDITTDNVIWLKSLPTESFYQVTSMSIWKDTKMESLGEVEEVFRSCSSSLRYLCINYCGKVRSVCGGLEHLEALKELVIIGTPNLKLEEEGNDDVIAIPWRSLYHSLRSLKLSNLPQLTNLPGWIQYLAALETLEIWGCKQVEYLPSWMSTLNSLRELYLTFSSPKLVERCQNPTGRDWPYIQHIPRVVIGW